MITNETIKEKSIGIISLGCDKNRVDTEKMLAKILDYGFKISNDLSETNILIINTCAFIQSARDESLEEIKNALKNKNAKLEKIIIAGCLNHYKEKYEDISSKVDCYIPIEENDKVVEYILKCYNLETENYEKKLGRLLTTPKHVAYLKIADGCNNYCAYCTIPKIRGPYHSIPIEDLISEAQILISRGVKELIIVAQDVTRYGYDIYKEYKLINLIDELSKLSGLERIRLHYCYPELMNQELIDFIANNSKVCNYVDIPLQHISDSILKSMYRRNSKVQAYELIEKLKSKNIAIRSTFIVGFPGETNEDFKELIKFIKIAKLDNVGFFKFSREAGTKAFELAGQVKEKDKEKRLIKLQNIQTKIYKKKQKEKIGTSRQVIIDSYDEKSDCYIGRDEFNSYGVDSVIYVISSRELDLGEIVNVKIIATSEIDLIGEVL